MQIWFGKCRTLGCQSEYECFLRRPENNCSNPPCKHTPDCIIEKGKIFQKILNFTILSQELTINNYKKFIYF